MHTSCARQYIHWHGSSTSTSPHRHCTTHHRHMQTQHTAVLHSHYPTSNKSCTQGPAWHAACAPWQYRGQYRGQHTVPAPNCCLPQMLPYQRRAAVQTEASGPVNHALSNAVTQTLSKRPQQGNHRHNTTPALHLTSARMAQSHRHQFWQHHAVCIQQLLACTRVQSTTAAATASTQIRIECA